MKTKSFIIFSTLVFATCVFVIVFHSQQPESIQNIVSQTHQHLKDFQTEVSFQENLKDVAENNLVQDEKYMKLLGFDSPPELWHNVTVPSIVSYGMGDDYIQSVGFLRSIQQKLPYTILFYNLGLTQYSLNVIANYCNSTKCVLMDLNLDAFPSHVSNEKLHAYRPLVIQHALSRAGGILFIENEYRVNGTSEQIDKLYKSAAQGSGVVAWGRRAAVTSLTHPRMFHYFRTEPDSFLFVQMVGGAQLLLAGAGSGPPGQRLADAVMRPWVRCALTHDCILPLGAQSGGCRFDKKPQYRYSGCHSYDVSALNILLGLHFNLDECHYTHRAASASADVHFYRATDDEARREYAALERNATADVSSHSAEDRLEHTSRDTTAA